jgi:Tubulin like
VTVGDLRGVLLRGVGIDPTAEELADALWLALLNAGRQGAGARSRSRPPVAPEPSSALSGRDREQAVPPRLRGSPQVPSEPAAPSDQAARPDSGSAQGDLQFHLPGSARAAGTRAGEQASVHVTTSPALSDPLGLARALRPLRRQMVSGSLVIDEEATADLIAEQRLWVPAMVPARERAIDLALVVDTSESMALWDSMVREFRLMCERLGAFRDVRLWHLTTGAGGSHPGPALRGSSPGSAERDPRELIDPAGRRLVLVVTDGVHPSWSPHGALRPLLARWAAAGPLAIVRPFPQRLWSRSMLRPVPAEFRADGEPGRRIVRPVRPLRPAGTGIPPGPPETRVAVPVLELLPAVFDRWARLVGGSAATLGSAAAVLVGASGDGDHEPAVLPPELREPADAAERVRAFRAVVSPAAYQLAGYLSSAAPLTLPVMRLVQDSMLPQTGPAELAEVFLSGLLRRVTPTSPQADAEPVVYEFADDVREALLSTITRPEAIRLLEQVGSYLARGHEGGRGFWAVLASLMGAEVATAATISGPFARISSIVLERIGGPYAEAARLITSSWSRAGGQRENALRWLESSYVPFSGRLYQPVLFVGLGGAGCDIGAMIERSLRQEICGPDGTKLLRQRHRQGMLPYQLPSCVQFVYADMDQSELDRMPGRVVPAAVYEPSVRATAQYARDLVPPADNYPDLARNLRLGAHDVTSSWLPPAEGEPNVNPLRRGAGQFPTVGRAALFGALMSGPAGVARDINAAIGRLARSGEDLHALGGGLVRAVNVFVAFSVAGGTGCGIFYDYLHLIGHYFDQNQLKAKIFPLVLMPSAFEPGLGGGRIAELNAGRALLDLFRLVDDQNAGDGLGLRSHYDMHPGDPDEQAVYYQSEGRITLRPGTVPTGFLFSRPAEAEREDLDRSIASLVMSLIGTSLVQDDEQGETYQSFADEFVNEGENREVPSQDGIGNQGVSTALAAVLTVPADNIAGIIAGRLLRTAIEKLSLPGPPESNRSLMETFLASSGVHPILTRRGRDIAEPEPANGARAVMAALRDRGNAMQGGLADLKVQLAHDVENLVSGFDPRKGVFELLGTYADDDPQAREMPSPEAKIPVEESHLEQGRDSTTIDLFRIQRVVFGHPDLEDGIGKDGAAGLLRRRLAAPPAPDGCTMDPPAVPHLDDVLPESQELTWSHPTLTRFRQLQDDWYRWRTQVTWADAWAAQSSIWQRPLHQVERELDALISELIDFAREDREHFNHRARDFYRPRFGVSLLLPLGATDMEHFYEQVKQRLIEHLASRGQLRANADEADILAPLIGPDGWRQAFEFSLDQNPRQAVTLLHDKIKTEVKSFLRLDDGDRVPMLPRLHDLLSAAALTSGRGGVLEDYVEEFRGKLAGLVPANFIPEGSGTLQVLVYYPADDKNQAIADYLYSRINLPHGQGVVYAARPTQAESLSVVLFRTSMGVTEVREIRRVLRHWNDALTRPEPADKLHWRQRTGYDFGYLATREADRVEILHRFLCALWNGRVEAVPQENQSSPERIRVVVLDGVTMNLQLNPFGQASSWGSLIPAYERWTFDDSEVHRSFSAQLMRELPNGLAHKAAEPAELYTVMVKLAEEQTRLLDEMIKNMPPESRTRALQMYSFWAVTLPAALDKPFDGIDSPMRPTLRLLQDVAAKDPP